MEPAERERLKIAVDARRRELASRRSVRAAYRLGEARAVKVSAASRPRCAGYSSYTGEQCRNRAAPGEECCGFHLHL